MTENTAPLAIEAAQAPAAPSPTNLLVARSRLVAAERAPPSAPLESGTPRLSDASLRFPQALKREGIFQNFCLQIVGSPIPET
jgi:hypothetical protein